MALELAKDKIRSQKTNFNLKQKGTKQFEGKSTIKANFCWPDCKSTACLTFACLPVCRLSVSLPACLSVCLTACLLPVCLPVYLPICLPVYLPICLPVCLYACLPVRLSACTPVCLYTCLPVRLSACTPVCLSACTVRLSTCLPA